MTSLKDWSNNASQILGKSDQYNLAISNAVNLKRYLGENLTFTGYSLGGGMAAACAMATNGSALTFNPAGVSPLTIDTNSPANINAYIVWRDELNLVQQAVPFFPKADGNIHWRDGGSSILGHDIENLYEPSVFMRAKDGIIRALMNIENWLQNISNPTNYY